MKQAKDSRKKQEHICSAIHCADFCCPKSILTQYQFKYVIKRAIGKQYYEAHLMQLPSGGIKPCRVNIARLLCILLFHREKPVSREDLLNYVWNGKQVSDASLTICVKTLRDLLSDERFFVNTVKGAGYMITYG